jgi:hypothetical protein
MSIQVETTSMNPVLPRGWLDAFLATLLAALCPAIVRAKPRLPQNPSWWPM